MHSYMYYNTCLKLKLLERKLVSYVNEYILDYQKTNAHW